MNPALAVLGKHLDDCMAMQSSASSTLYINQIKLAIRVLENYEKVLQKTISAELEKTTI